MDNGGQQKRIRLASVPTKSREHSRNRQTARINSNCLPRVSRVLKVKFKIKKNNEEFVFFRGNQIMKPNDKMFLITIVDSGSLLDKMYSMNSCVNSIIRGHAEMGIFLCGRVKYLT